MLDLWNQSSLSLVPINFFLFYLYILGQTFMLLENLDLSLNYDIETAQYI